MDEAKFIALAVAAAIGAFVLWVLSVLFILTLYAVIVGGFIGGTAYAIYWVFKTLAGA